MRKLYKGTLLFLSWACCALAPTTNAQAQAEARNWYFGNQAGITFTAGLPTSLSGSAMTSYEGCATISTAAGQLAMYSNGEQVWDATQQVMPNGAGLGGHNSASQGALLLRAPGSSSRYYLFTVDAIDNNLVGGLRYSIIDLSLHGGLGDVTTKSVRLPTPALTGKVTEKLTAALHSNGQDYWIVVHGWENNQFYSFQLSASGLSTTPVISTVGPVHQGGGSFFGAANAVGYMRISPNGAKLALAQRDTQFELYDFNNATGQVANFISLTGVDSNHYGVEFSPDNSRLYTTNYSATAASSRICQFNLLAGSAAAIQASRTTIGTISGLCVVVQSGFNGKLYLSSLNQATLNSIEQPNALGTACSFQNNAVALAQKLGQNGLPNFPNAFSLPVATSSLNAELNANAAIFPNPARSQFALTVPESMRRQPVLVTLTDMQGQVKMRQTAAAQGPQGTLVVPIGGLTKGVYVVRASSPAGTLEKKLVVE